MPEFLLEHASRFGDKPALVDGPTGRTLTYRQLAGGVERVAAGLAARGFGKGDVLALSSPNLPEYALALYGAMAAGGAVTAANPLLTAGELAGQLADAGASLLVTVPPFLETARAAAEKAGVAEVLVFGEADGATPFRELVGRDHPPARPGRRPRARPGRPALLQRHHRPAQGRRADPCQPGRQRPPVQAAIGFRRRRRGRRGGAVLPRHRPQPDPALQPAGGGDARHHAPLRLRRLPRVVQRYRATSTMVVPPVILALAGHPLVDDYDLSSLHFVGCGAAPLGAEVEQRCADRLGCLVAQGFGMTEGSATFAIAPLDTPRRGSAGRLLPGTQARIVDPDAAATSARAGPGSCGCAAPR